jgi:hypothetical protein
MAYIGLERGVTQMKEFLRWTFIFIITTMVLIITLPIVLFKVVAESGLLSEWLGYYKKRYDSSNKIHVLANKIFGEALKVSHE